MFGAERGAAQKKACPKAGVNRSTQPGDETNLTRRVLSRLCGCLYGRVRMGGRHGLAGRTEERP